MFAIYNYCFIPGDVSYKCFIFEQAIAATYQQDYGQNRWPMAPQQVIQVRSAVTDFVLIQQHIGADPRGGDGGGGGGHTRWAHVQTA